MPNNSIAIAESKPISPVELSRLMAKASASVEANSTTGPQSIAILARRPCQDAVSMPATAQPVATSATM